MKLVNQAKGKKKIINLYISTYALCLAKPICKSVCSGVNCCLPNRVGVCVLRGGKDAIFSAITFFLL